MLKEPTVEKLKLLRLNAMADALAAQQAQPQIAALSFDERFGLLVDAEWLHRENVRLSRALKEAKLRMSNACVEDVECGGKRELDKALVRQLGTCRWVAEHQNIVITGKTGTTVRVRRRVMHLVDHDVIEVLGLETCQVLAARELGDRREHEVCRKLTGVAKEPADPRDLVKRAQLASIGSCSLLQQLAAMRDEQHARPSAYLLPKLCEVERREPRLSQPCRENNDRAPPALRSRRSQLRERFPLYIAYFAHGERRNRTMANTETGAWRSERSDAGWSYLIGASSFRREGPFSTTRWALWSSRSQTASATVGSPR